MRLISGKICLMILNAQNINSLVVFIPLSFLNLHNNPCIPSKLLSLSEFFSGNLILERDVLTLQIAEVPLDQEAKETLTHIHTHRHRQTELRRTKRE